MASSMIVTAGAPCSTRTDPYTAHRLITTSTSSTAYAYATLGTVMIGGTAANAASPITHSPAFSTSCASYTVLTPGAVGSGKPNAETVVANPAYAKVIDTAANISAIGSPNRDTMFYQNGGNVGPAGYASSSYSTIEVLQLTGTTVTSTTQIEDFTTPLLGSSFSLAGDGASLAAVFDPSTIAVYSPVIGRQFSYFNVAGTDKDVTFALPASFRVSSVSH